MEAPRMEPQEPQPVEKVPPAQQPYVQRVPEQRVVGVPAAEPMMRHDIVRWGPVVAGFFFSLATLIFLGTLGLALNLAVGGGGAAAAAARGGAITGAEIYGSIIMIIAFFLGGWIAGRTSAARGLFPGVVNGTLVWALTLLALAWFGSVGAGLLFGFGGAAFGASGPNGAPVVAPGSSAAWWAFGALVVSLIFAILGGLVGGSYIFGRKVEQRPVP